MKYLKTYEKYKESDFKKYFIGTLFDSLAIFNIIEMSNKNMAEIKILLIYNKTNDEIKEFKGGEESYKKSLDIIKNKILFQSDNIQDCIDIIPILSDTIKYNL